MIWIDITDPKYALFFRELIPHLKTLDSLIITTRKSQGYEECAILLQKFNIKALCIGGYGGKDIKDKFKARLARQEEFLKLFEKIGLPKLFITGASADGAQSAFGLGIPIVHFSDTPIASYRFKPSDITILSRLTLPLSTLIFHPFVVPKSVYKAFGIESKNIISYDFIDVALWLTQIPPKTESKNPLRLKFGFDEKPIILAREEEYKAHYVKQHLSVLYDALESLATNNKANIIIIPRYESDIQRFHHFHRITILKEKLFVEEFYPYIDMLIGGGGTMNLEACFLGIPTISTRSLWLYHDKYLIDNHLMKHCVSVDEVMQAFLEFEKKNFKRTDNKKFFFHKYRKHHKTPNITTIINEIKKRFYY